MSPSAVRPKSLGFRVRHEVSPKQIHFESPLYPPLLECALRARERCASNRKHQKTNRNPQKTNENPFLSNRTAFQLTRFGPHLTGCPGTLPG